MAENNEKHAMLCTTIIDGKEIGFIHSFDSKL